MLSLPVRGSIHHFLTTAVAGTNAQFCLRASVYAYLNVPSNESPKCLGTNQMDAIGR